MDNKKAGSSKGKKTSNVFKVTGARSNKVKKKASGGRRKGWGWCPDVPDPIKQLKKESRARLRQMIKEMEKELDAKHTALQNEMMQPEKQKEAEAARQAAVFSDMRQSEADRLQKAEQHEKTKDDIDKLSELMMS